ncbi:hypothetical protein PGT21_031326 [Puccinia graminis f. sp. tritici]|uniref:Uncharacterized protein n=1 Tax=Puccinia graminis f. sp. tritici TaxID=56615 RepID=A0A5B0LQ35_PUCGR|nr:hypothetical protein PGT21_031326 [Puccinia graminis f. sp. tritici]
MTSELTAKEENSGELTLLAPFDHSFSVLSSRLSPVYIPRRVVFLISTSSRTRRLRTETVSVSNLTVTLKLKIGRPVKIGGSIIYPFYKSSCSPTPATSKSKAPNESISISFISLVQGKGQRLMYLKEAAQKSPYAEFNGCPKHLQNTSPPAEYSQASFK